MGSAVLHLTKMDLGWGGVPRMQPSDTALSYLNSIHKFVKDEDLPAGSHLRSSRIMEGLRGFKQCKKDLAESHSTYHREVMRHQTRHTLASATGPGTPTAPSTPTPGPSSSS